MKKIIYILTFFITAISLGQVKVGQYADGTDIFAAESVPEQDPPNIRTLSGTVDADVLLLDIGVEQAYHIQAVLGDLTFTSASLMTTVIDGVINQQNVVEPLVIPFGTDFKIYRDNAGSPVIYYKTFETGVSSDIGNNLTLGSDGLPLLSLQSKDTILIYRQDVSAGNFFTNLTDLEYANETSSDPSTETKYSILGDNESFRNSDGKFTYILKYQDNIPTGDVTASWSQTSNFMTGAANTVQGFQLISNTANDNSFGGLSINNSNGRTTLLQGNPGASNWWWSIGATSVWAGAGGAGVPSVLNPQTSSGLIELYAVVDTQGIRFDIVSDSTGNLIQKDGLEKAYLSQSDIETFTPANYSTEEIWLKIGQSNSVGTDGSGPIDHTGLDQVHPKVFEFSRGIDRANVYLAAPAGELHPYRHPSQDDGAGIGFGQMFGKERVRLNPEIEKLIIVNRGVGGTGFAGNRWNPGDDLYTLAVNDLKTALANNPNAVFAGIVWHQGESDAGQGQAFYEAALSAMVEGIRTEAENAAPGRVKGAFICGTMVESWIAANEAARRPIDLAHRNVANYIDNSTFADFSEITDLQDVIHFGTGGLREMGKIYADEIQKLSNLDYQSYRLKIVDNQVTDLFGGGGTIGGAKIIEDAERGYVIDTESIGNVTGMFMRPDEYTKSCWVKVLSTPTQYGNLMSGQHTAGLINNHYWGWVGSGQNASTTDPTITGISNHVTVGQWVHLTLTSIGTTHTIYVNGVQAGTATVNDLTFDPQRVLLGAITSPTSNGLDALVDDIVILPYALDDTGAANLYDLVLEPISNSQQSVTGTVTQATNYEIPSTAFTNTGLTMTLPEAGTYLITYDVRGLIQPETDAGRFVQAQLFNTTLGSAVPNTSRIIVYSSVGANRVETTGAITTTITVTQPTDIDLQALINNTSATLKFVASDTAGLTSASFVKIK